MVRYRLKEIVKEIRENPREDLPEGEKPHKLSYYRIWKDTGLAHSTVRRMATDKPVKLIYAHTLEKLLSCINNRRNQSTPEYTLNDLLEIVNNDGQAQSRRKRKKG